MLEQLTNHSIQNLHKEIGSSSSPPPPWSSGRAPLSSSAMANSPPLPLLLFFFFFLFPVSAIDFVYNGFNSNDGLLLYGNASVTAGHLAVTNDSTFSLGRALYKTKIPAKSSSSSAGVLSFFTSFIFAISPVSGHRPGHGLAFLFAPAAGTGGAASAQHLGLFNYTTNGRDDNHILAVEFDLFPNPEFQDIDGNHVGVDINSLTSVTSNTAGYYPDSTTSSAASFVNLTLNSGANYQAWVDYRDLTLNITMAPAGVKKPQRPLISTPLDLSAVFEEEMYMGFCAGTGALLASHRVLAWSFSNTNFSAYEALITTNLPSFIPHAPSSGKSKTFVAAISATSAALAALLIAGGFLVYARRRRRMGANQGMEDWELDYWPHRIDYREIHRSTGGLSDENQIGTGGNGTVYKGTLPGIGEVAVKCIACGADGGGIRQFLAEVSTLGRLTHRNLVPLRGWSKKTTTTTFTTATTLILIYDYMANGSLDKLIFFSGDEKPEPEVLSWEARLTILRDVGSALVYMHEGWAPSRVLHRDIKASNVMLDKEMRGRLGDFGLARLQTNSAASFAAAGTTRVLGTVGYMAPELLQTGKATVETDVYGFGVLVLETVTGRRPDEDGRTALVDWVWGLMEKGEAVRALDRRLVRQGGYEAKEVERVLGLGLACTHPDPRVRPSMREAVKALDGPVDSLSGPLGQGMEAHLLESGKEKGKGWYYASLARAHPTFKELRDSLSSSVSLSISDVIVEGR